MKILVRKANNEIVSFCEGSIKYDKNIFDLKDFEIPEESKKKIFEEGQKPYFKNNKLELIKIFGENKEDIKQQVESAKSIDDLKNIIYKLL